jgi:hypothetical protein
LAKALDIYKITTGILKGVFDKIKIGLGAIWDEAPSLLPTF